MFMVLDGLLISSDALLGAEGTFQPLDGDSPYPTRVKGVLVCAGCGQVHLDVEPV